MSDPKETSAESLHIDRHVLQSMIDVIPHGICLKDLDGRFVIVNRTFADSCGMRSDEVVGLRTDDLPGLTEAEKALLRDQERAIIERGESPWGDEMELQRVDGHPHARHLYQSVLWDSRSGIRGVVGFAENEGRLRQATMEPLNTQKTVQTIFDSVPNWLYVKDREGRYLAVNKSMAEWYGCRPSDIAGKTFAEIVLENDQLPASEQIDMSVEADEAVLEAHQPVTIPESRMVNRDGQIRTHQVVKLPLKDDADNVIGIIGASSDITQLKHAEEELRSSESRLKTVFDSVGEGVITADEKGTIFMVNSAVSRIFGYNADELTGRNLSMLMPEPYIGEHDGYIENYVRTGVGAIVGTMVREVTGLRKDGTLVPLDLSLSEAVSYGKRQFTGIVRDITRRKQAEAEHATLLTALEQAGDSIFITDINGTIQYVNAAFEKMTGYARDEAIGRSPNILKSGKMSESVYGSLWQSLLRGRTWQRRLTNRRKDGTLIEVDCTNAPIRSPGGTVTNFVSVQKDVTRQIMLEKQVLHSQRLDALGTLAGGIAHDLNNILSPIMGFSYVLSEELGPESEQYPSLVSIINSVHRAQELVNQILLFSRGSEGNFGPCHLPKIAREVTKFIRSTLPATLNVEAALADDVTPIYADTSQVYQVILNLCINGGQAMPNGGTLRISVENTELDGDTTVFGTQLSGPYVKITIADSGVGMDEEQLSHIFEPFYTTKEAGKGTGLGLSTVFGIVQQHQGGILVSSQPGLGTTFEVLFPVADGNKESGDVAEAPARDTSGSETILYVDDEEGITKAGRKILERQGYRVTTCTSAVSAIEYFRTHPDEVELVITDQTMPLMSGLELVQKLREIRENVPVILCTGYSASVSAATCQELGIDGPLYKPIHPGDLRIMVREVLDRTHQSQC